jgi:hypothetical protein
MTGLGIVSLAMMASVAVTTVHGQPTQNAVRAELFELVDAQGTLRARLGVSGRHQEYTYLDMMNAAGQDRVRISVYPDQPPSIQIMSATGAKIGDLVQGAQVGATGGRPIRRVVNSTEKADDASPGDVRRLQSQIDVITSTVNDIVDRLNAASQ